MTTKLKPNDLHNIIKEYRSGGLIDDLAAKYGVSRGTIYIRLVKAGVEMRTRSETTRVKAGCSIGYDEILNAYNGGESINSISNRTGISRPAITRAVTRLRGTLRTQSEQEVIKWRGMTAEQRSAQVAPAHAAAKVAMIGFRPSESVYLAGARERAKSKRMTRYEVWICDYLISLGLEVIPQKQVGPYNVDFAINGFPVAVEVMRGVGGRKHRPRIQKRMEHLFSGGWAVVFIYLSQCAANDLSRIDKHLVPIVDQARRGEPIAGKCWVIRCNPNPGSALCADLDGIPIIECA
jgi:transposase